ncbi:protein kinase superfamily protein isoform X1 [Wolffia australiana]
MNRTEEIIVGACVGVGGGILLSLGLFFLLRCFLLNSRGNKKKTKDEEQIASEMPMRMNDVLAVMDSSGSLESISQLPGIIQRKIPPQVRAAQSNALASASGIPRYSYKDIKESTHNFTTTVGKGSFGSVYKAEMPDGAVVAVKVLAANSRQGDKEFQTEVLLLSKLHHRNLVNLIGFCVEKGQYMLVYEFMSNGSLASHLYGVQSLTWEERINIALDISRGIQYLHEGTVPPVIHRDLKSANILLDSSLTAKVADFGLSKQGMALSRKASGLKGTYGYIDPDYVLTNVITTKSDIYSFGIIIFELLTAINPQQGLLDYINLAMAGGDGKADWDEILDKRLVGNCDLKQVQLLADVAYTCLHKIPRKRPSISEITEAILKIKGRRPSHISR